MTHQLTLLLAATLPAVALLLYFARMNAGAPQPVGRLWRVALAGGFAAIACGVIELGLLKLAGPVTSYERALLHGFGIAALVEESAKLACFRLIVARRPELDTRFNAILSGVQAALGFSLVENLLYFEKVRAGGHLLDTLLVRAVLSVPMHVLCTGLCAVLSSRGRLDRVGPGWPAGLALAVLLHGAYDAAIFAVPLASAGGPAWLPTLLTALPIAIALGGFLELRARAAVALERDRAALEAQRVNVPSPSLS